MTNRYREPSANRMGTGFLFTGYGPKPVLEAPNDGGIADDEAAKAAAAAKAVADKAAADKAAADKAALDEQLKGLSNKEAELLKDVMKKKEKLAEKDKALLDLQTQIKQFEGIDPVKVRELLKKEADAEQAAKDAETKALEAKGEFDRVKTMMADEHAKQLKVKEDEVTSTKSALSQAQAQINDLTVGSSFSMSSFVTDELVLTPAKARTVYGAHFDVENNVVIAYDRPKGEANRTKLVDASGTPLAFEAALKKIVDADPDRDRLVKSKIGTGAGSKTENRKETPKNTELTGAARMAAALAAKASAKG